MSTILCTGVIVAQLLLTVRAKGMTELSWDCQHPSCRFDGTKHIGNIVVSEFKVEGKRVFLWHVHKKLFVECNGNDVLESAALPRASSTWNVSQLELHRCPLPVASSLRAVVTTLNVALHCNSGDQDSLCELHLNNIPSTRSLAASHFLGLEQLQKLSIDVDHPMTPTQNFLAPLQNLLTLFLKNVILPIGSTIPTLVRNLEVHYEGSEFNVRGILPVSSGVETLSVVGWRDPEPQPLSNCEALQKLHISDSAVQSLPDYWVANCSRLEHLEIIKAKNFTLTPKLLFGASALVNLSFVSLELKVLPVGLLDFSPNLQSLRLADNNLFTLPRDLFKPLKYLSYLDLSANPGFDDICEPDGYSPLRKLSQLKTLILSETGVRKICRDWREDMPRLQRLNLSDSDLSQISFQDFQFKAVSLKVYFWGMSVMFTPLTREEFVEARDITINVTVDFENPLLLNCSCHTYWTWRALQLSQLKFLKDIICTDGRLLRNMPFEEFWCQRSEQCAAVAFPAECSCESLYDECIDKCEINPMPKRWIIRAHCEKASLSSFPTLPNNSSFIYDLHLADNNITEVLEHDLQHDIETNEDLQIIKMFKPTTNRKRTQHTGGITTLNGNAYALGQINASILVTRRVDQAFGKAFEDETLDLSNNPLQVMDDVTAKRLDNVKGILRIAGNQINCSCRIMPLLRALQDRNLSLTELNEAYCSDGRTLYAAFTMDCSSGVPLAAWLVLVIVCLASALVLGAATVSFFWSRQRRFFARAVLHRWGWTRRAEENDDRYFDAFLTFSHRDTAVARAVMTRLEPRYRLCVHVRDWTPGKMILTQIVESVQDSRRTVALVSRHFLASKWARAEFREAHLAAMLDERPRLVVVLLEDPRELQMEEQLSGYIATRTYLRWGEALFWNKLAVALPPPRENYSFEEYNFLIEVNNEQH